MKIILTCLLYTICYVNSIFAQSHEVPKWAKKWDTTTFTRSTIIEDLPETLFEYLPFTSINEIANDPDRFNGGCVFTVNEFKYLLNWIAYDNKNHWVVNISSGGKRMQTNTYYIDYHENKTRVEYVINLSNTLNPKNTRYNKFTLNSFLLRIDYTNNLEGKATYKGSKDSATTINANLFKKLELDEIKNFEMFHPQEENPFQVFCTIDTLAISPKNYLTVLVKFESMNWYDSYLVTYDTHDKLIDFVLVRKGDYVESYSYIGFQLVDSMLKRNSFRLTDNEEYELVKSESININSDGYFSKDRSPVSSMYEVEKH